MKRIFLILLFPFLVAFQCDDDVDTGFETTYIIRNDSSTDLYFLDSQERFVGLPGQSELSIGSALKNEASPLLPSESFVFNDIRLYRSENGNFILSYQQDPVEDEIWSLTEPSINRFEYTLVITDVDLN
ncbi:hypothetical protein [Lentiprolixibacter aurantiacus]|uniref:Uncharacterized protein n=1 Tax=Lentiprolixibacter aurantiacus TaxID=2993939 RepID=A0AAE3SLT6_9FLAO|nr:hypothetical protein [Lentiprolixibacter aurantiacus]MCX2718032.1 hypothetical protein [Lentiprolixibacter aurantiacus]